MRRRKENEMERETPTPEQKKFIKIKLVAIWLPIVWGLGYCFTAVNFPFMWLWLPDLAFAVIQMVCCATAIALSIYYLANYSRTDGRMMAAVLCIAFNLLVFTSFLIGCLE